MAKIGIEEARVYAFLEQMVLAHEKFNKSPHDITMAHVCSANALSVTALFNINPRDVPHILESVIKRERDREYWGMIFYDKLIEKGN